MEENKSMEVFAKAPIRKAVLQNALPAMAAMLMVLIYIPAMFILSAIFHETGLIWAQPVADVLSLLLALVLYMRNSKRLTGNEEKRASADTKNGHRQMLFMYFADIL